MREPGFVPTKPEARRGSEAEREVRPGRYQITVSYQTREGGTTRKLYGVEPDPHSTTEALFKSARVEISSVGLHNFGLYVDQRVEKAQKVHYILTNVDDESVAYEGDCWVNPSGHVFSSEEEAAK